MRDEKGHATAEAVIMIPFFVIVWGCIIYVSNTWEETVDVGAVTRAHAWAHATDGCRGGVPSGTELTNVSDAPLGIVGDLIAIISEVVSLIPLLDEYWPDEFWPEEYRYVRRSSVEQPEVIGGETQRVGHQIVLMCNEIPKHVDLNEMADKAWFQLGF